MSNSSSRSSDVADDKSAVNSQQCYLTYRLRKCTGGYSYNAASYARTIFQLQDTDIRSHDITRHSTLELSFSCRILIYVHMISRQLLTPAKPAPVPKPNVRLRCGKKSAVRNQDTNRFHMLPYTFTAMAPQIQAGHTGVTDCRQCLINGTGIKCKLEAAGKSTASKKTIFHGQRLLSPTNPREHGASCFNKAGS